MADRKMQIEVDAWGICVCGHLVSRHVEHSQIAGRGKGCRVSQCRCKHIHEVLVVEKARLFVFEPTPGETHPLALGLAAARSSRARTQKTAGWVCSRSDCDVVEDLIPRFETDMSSSLYCPRHVTEYISPQPPKAKWQQMLDNF